MRKKLLAVAAAGLLAACTSMRDFNPNPLTWLDKPTGPKPAELPTLTNPQNVRVLWSSSIGAGEGFVFSPALSGDSVYAASRSGTVARIDVENGQARWRVTAGTRLSGGVGSDGNVVVVASEEGEVIALDAGSGRPKWRSRVSSEVLAAPKLSDGLVLVRSADSRIFAFDAVDGKRRWVYQRPASSLIVRSPVGLTVAQGSAYAGFSGGKLVAITLTNGQARWEGTVALPKGATELERIADITSQPFVDERSVCAVAYQGRVACFEVVRGTPLWTRDISSLAGLTGDERNLYVTDDKGAVHALDRANGASVWKQEALAARRVGGPQLIGSDLVGVIDVEGYLHLLSRADGSYVGRLATDGSPSTAQPARRGTSIVWQSDNGNVYSVGAR